MFRSTRGFTLVETMVAVLMLTVVIGAIYGTYRAASSSASLAEERADLNQTARVLLSQINRELTCAYQPASARESSIVGENTEGSESALQHDRLQVLTTAQSTIPVKGPSGDQRLVTYTLETNSFNEPLAFFVQVDPRPDLSVSDEEPEPVELSAMVVGFNCKYLDGDTDEWQDEWTNRQVLPKAVRVELFLRADREGAKPVFFATTANLANQMGPGAEQAVQEEIDAE